METATLPHAAPLPATVQATNEEFQAAAKSLLQRPRLAKDHDDGRPSYWQGPPVTSSWSKEEPFLKVFLSRCS